MEKTTKKLELKYNQTLIFYIKILRETKQIPDWKTGVEIYFNMEGQEISIDALTAQTKKLKLENINQVTLFKYCADNDKNIPKDPNAKKEEELSELEQKRKKLAESTVFQTLKITEDKFSLFGIDIDKDSPIEMEAKVQRRIGDENFIIGEVLEWDPGKWYIEKYNPGSWTVNMKLKKEDGTDEPHIELNSKTNLVLKQRKQKFPYAINRKEADQFLQDWFKKEKITPFEIFESVKKTSQETIVLSEDLLLVCTGFEAHIGKLGSKSDFENYSTKHALARLKITVNELVDFQKRMGASGLLLGVGNDFYNSDTVDNKTTAGTQQDNDTRHKELYLTGKKFYFRAIETLKQYFDKIMVKGNPGNHDEKSSFSLFSNIYDVYNWTKDPKVEVNMTHKDMWFSTCHIHGDNLIILCHGKSGEGKPLPNKELAKLAKKYFPEELRKCKNVYIHAGHLHQDQEKLEVFENVHVMRHAALSGTDAWHANSGYVGSRQGHTVYLYHKEKGLIAQRYITLTDEEKKMKIKPAIEEYEDFDKAVEKALDLSPDSVEKALSETKIKDLNSSIASEKDKYSHRAKKAAIALGVDPKSLGDQDIDNVLDAIGYNEVIAPYSAEIENVKLYKSKTKKTAN